MAARELHHTLTAAVEAVSPAPGSGLVVTAVEIDLPLELVAARRGSRLVIAGGAPHSRWEAGVLPAVHLAHLQLALVDPPPPARRDDA